MPVCPWVLYFIIILPLWKYFDISFFLSCQKSSMWNLVPSSCEVADCTRLIILVLVLTSSGNRRTNSCCVWFVHSVETRRVMADSVEKSPASSISHNLKRLEPACGEWRGRRKNVCVCVCECGCEGPRCVNMCVWFPWMISTHLWFDRFESISQMIVMLQQPFVWCEKHSSINANNLHFTCNETNEVFSPIMNKETPSKITMLDSR